jgi:hypothetical protein
MIRPLYSHRDALTVDDELPMVDCVRGLPQQNAAETLEIFGIDWPAVSTEEGGSPHHDKSFWRCQPDGDHDMPKSDSCVEPFLNNVDQPVLAYELQLDIGIQIQEIRQQPIHQQWQTRSRHVDTQSTADLPAQTACCIQTCCQHFYRRTRMRQKSISGFRQPDTTTGDSSAR